MIKALIFDLGGVFLSLQLVQVVENLQQLLHSKVSLFGSKMHEDYENGFYTPEEFYRQVLFKYGKSDQDFSYEMFQKAWNSALGPRREGMFELLQKLRQTHPQYEIYLLSNTDPVHWEVLQARDHIDQLFDHCFLSFEMGVTKPDTVIYHKVLKHIGKEADECIFLDDSRENIQAARKVGMNAIHVKLKKDAHIAVVNELGNYGIYL